MSHSVYTSNRYTPFGIWVIVFIASIDIPISFGLWVIAFIASIDMQHLVCGSGEQSCHLFHHTILKLVLSLPTHVAGRWS